MLLPASLLSMWVKPRIQVQPAGVLGVGRRKEGERGEQHTMWVSGEDHNDAVAHAATGLGKIRQGEETRKDKGEKRRVVLDVHPETKEKRKMGKRERGEARWKNRVHLTTSARRCSSHATMPCCCVRSASMSMPMRGNVMCGISCHHHHDELFVCQCVLQPAIPVCVCREHASAGSRRSTHTPKKRDSVCV